jgi:hypothetical protein
MQREHVHAGAFFKSDGWVRAALYISLVIILIAGFVIS